jgi:hypothetical protein
VGDNHGVFLGDKPTRRAAAQVARMIDFGSVGEDSVGMPMGSHIEAPLGFWGGYHM